ncbi:MAG: thioredoxin family protein [candidate division Zixibacteria bacterium]|nr:thioredoxin family protein [candidate division Zixibacteria bacterium]
MNNNINNFRNMREAKKNSRMHSGALTRFFFMSSAALAIISAANVSATEVRKYNNFAEAQTAAKEANLPILIDFYTDWCKYCKQMDTATFADPKVITWLNKNVIFAKIDSEDENKDRTAFAESYGVRGYPTFALVRADGSELDRAVGFLDSEHFITTFTEYKNDQNTLNDFLRRLDKQPSAKLHYDIGEKLRWRGKSAEAEAHFASAISLDKDNSAGIAADCKWSLADLARRDKNYPAAIKRYKELIASFPDYEKVTDAHLYVGLCLRDAGQRQEAIAQFERFKALFPDSEDVEYADKKIKQIKEDIEGS